MLVGGCVRERKLGYSHVSVIRSEVPQRGKIAKRGGGVVPSRSAPGPLAGDCAWIATVVGRGPSTAVEILAWCQQSPPILESNWAAVHHSAAGEGGGVVPAG
ncbi:hypothetical protein C0J52_21435 [Blattella germanica]|nr:hypothetical protein C0J52_21435 [Blattella germanica]